MNLVSLTAPQALALAGLVYRAVDSGEVKDPAAQIQLLGAARSLAFALAQDTEERERAISEPPLPLKDKKKAGRPAGSKNKPKPPPPAQTEIGAVKAATAGATL